MELVWQQFIRDFFKTDVGVDLKKFVQNERAGGIPIYPAPQNLFQAFELCPFAKIKVVILGQDPYHGPGQAHGLCFSVPSGIPLPPSLRNIIKELSAELSLQQMPKSGDLSGWATQGVLLLNTVLTVRQGQPQSHQNRGWEKFTDAVIQKISQEKSGVVFVLWGSPAQKKKILINLERHTVIESVHPSPLSAHRGFLGSRPFSKINQSLQSRGMTPIDWSL